MPSRTTSELAKAIVLMPTCLLGLDTGCNLYLQLSQPSLNLRYIEVDVNSTFHGSTLDITAEIAIAVNATLSQAAPNVLRFAGEIGPHNGGSPPCDHTSMRWSTFANSFW